MPTAVPVPTKAELESPRPRPLVLVVDDDHGSRRLLARALEGSGFAVSQASNGAEALESVSHELPDVVLLDFEMPELDGVETCLRMRHHSSSEIRELPVIMLTAHDGEDEEVRCLESGANDFLSKPVGRASLTARIQTQLRLRALGSELREQNVELERWRAAHTADLEAARTTQQAIIPQRVPDVDHWRVEATYVPLIQVGGDVYGFRRLSNGSLLVWLADATGHGASAALFTTLTSLLFHHASVHSPEPDQILDEVNREFHSVFRGRSFMTACCARFDPDGTVTHSSAGHPPLLIRRNSGEVEAFNAGATMLGILPQLRPDQSKFHVSPGDSIILFTDGLYSVKSSNGDHLHLQWEIVQSALSALESEASPQAIVNWITEAVDGDSFDDDLTVLTVHRRGQ